MLTLSAKLLKWYDASARELPWRTGPAARKGGARPDPYRVWLSEIMLQQTTVATVRPRYEQFLARWPTIDAMAAASLDDVLSEWAGLGYYARARNLHQCAVAVAASGGFPDTEDHLRALPGVGAYTAAAIAAIAFDRHAIVMDGNIERVAARLFAIETPLPKAKPELKALIAGVWPKKRSGDFAQGLMDLGAGVCTSRNPKCLLCPLNDHCAGRAKGIAEGLPLKAKKAEKPTRRGVAYALLNDKGEVLFERRPEKGLLGGMLGLPGTEWVEEKRTAKRATEPSPVCGRAQGARASSAGARPEFLLSPNHWTHGPIPLAGTGSAWRSAGTIRHSFTHFHLELDVMIAHAPRGLKAGEGQQWLAPDRARLPTVMRKAVAAAGSQAR